MEKGGRIFIMRHGPTHKDVLDFNEFDLIVDQIVDFLIDNGGVDKIITSPISRCTDTANILIDKLNNKGNHNRTCVKEISQSLERIRNYENWDDVQIRGYNYGKSIKSTYNQKDVNVLLITHSSILMDVVRGVVNDRTIEKTHLNPASMTYVSSRGRIKEFNIKWHKYSKCPNCGRYHKQ